jgi:hypothetical protein
MSVPSLKTMLHFGYNQCLQCRSLDIDTEGERARCCKCGSLRIKNFPAAMSADEPAPLTPAQHNAFPKGRY